MNRFSASLFCHLLFTRRSLRICHRSGEGKYPYKRFAKNKTASFRKNFARRHSGHICRSQYRGEKREKAKKKSKESRSPKAPEYEYRHQLWLVTLNGNQPPRQLTFHEGGASNPVWHPGGKQIAFVRTVEEKSQIFVLPLRVEKHGNSQR